MIPRQFLADQFYSSLDNLQRFTDKHQSLFPILADENAQFHQQYGVQYSWGGVIKGVITRLPTLIKSLLKGHIPWRIKGKINTMPMNFLVNEQGLVETAYYGLDEGDHLTFDAVKAFSHG